MGFQNLTEEQIKAMINLGGAAGQNKNHGVKKAHFLPLVPQPTEPAQEDISCLNDVEVEMRAELAGTSINLRELLALQPGQVIALNRLAGNTVDLRVNQVWLAHGEVLVLNNALGVKITSFKGDVNHPGWGAK